MMSPLNLVIYAGLGVWGLNLIRIVDLFKLQDALAEQPQANVDSLLQQIRSWAKAFGRGGIVCCLVYLYPIAVEGSQEVAASIAIVWAWVVAVTEVATALFAFWTTTKLITQVRAVLAHLSKGPGASV